ncbi:MAG: chromate efflux transporter [Chloroflexota bacterium]|jgi:chromate transporter|nr:chromate efflux transporter [Chloroflexota bacterium]|tara:strand:+ start:2918 stop:4189 length:1272 start_codon:yes stop_codon:yes gene_type:complete
MDNADEADAVAEEPTGPTDIADGAPFPISVGSLFQVFWAALRLGLTSFGGPIAHLGYFREEYVVRRKWLDEQSYADVVALAQSLPGPASSKVGIIVGTVRAGLPGAVLAWLGFTMPSAIALMVFGYGVQQFAVADAGWLHGLKLAAVAVVAQAVWGMSRNLAPDRERATIAIVAAIVALTWHSAVTPVLIIVIAGVVGWRLLPAPVTESDRVAISQRIRPWMGIVALVLFFVLLLGLPSLRQVSGENQTLAVVDSFYRSGSLVFGGGHVVLPLLQSEVVAPGWVGNETFLAGYGAAQAVPGPLFTFSAYLGTVMIPEPNGVIGGLIALGAIFLPAFFLTIGPLPFWDILRRRPAFQSVLRGVNAAVVGLLLAALYDPVWTSAVKDASDFALASAALGLLMLWKLPPWLVVILSALGGAGLAAI